MSYGRITGRKGHNARVQVQVDILTKSTGSPWVAQACVKSGKRRQITTRSCGRAVGGRSIQSAVGKALKALGVHVALRGKRLAVSKSGRKFRY